MFKKLINEFSLILLALMMQSCSSEDGAAKTEIDGTWTRCISSIQTFDVGGAVVTMSGSSTKATTTYQGNATSTLIETYSDADCINLTSTAGPVKDSFKIGNKFTSINGVIVTEIDFSTNDYKTIYLLQDGGNTLYFGKQCDFINAQCSNNRPLEINYDFPSFKVN